MVVYWFNLLVLLWAVILQYSISFTVPHSYRLALTKSSAYKYSNFCSRLRSIRKQSGELSARTQGNEDNPTPIYYLPNSPISIDSVVGYVQQWARENQEAMTEIQVMKDILFSIRVFMQSYANRMLRMVLRYILLVPTVHISTFLHPIRISRIAVFKQTVTMISLWKVD